MSQGILKYSFYNNWYRSNNITGTGLFEARETLKKLETLDIVTLKLSS